MNNLLKKIAASALTATMVVGTVGITSAAVNEGTDITGQTGWKAFSIHSREDGGEWEDSLTKKSATPQKWCLNADEASGVDATWTYGEYAKMKSQTPSAFAMDVISTGWSASYGPKVPVQKDKDGNLLQEVKNSNPWGVTADKVVNVERGRTYTLKFKIKGDLENEITETANRKDGTLYTKGTGKFNYVKHVHFKVYDDSDKDGAALKIKGTSAVQGTKNVLTVGDTKKINKDFNVFIALDKKNTDNDGYVDVTTKFTIPADKAKYQKKKAVPSVGIKFAFGAFLKEFPDENNMHGTIEVKNFQVLAGPAVTGKTKITSLKAKKKGFKVKFKKAAKAKKYQVQYSLKKSMKKAKTKTISKKSLTVKKLKSKKTYYVRVRGLYKVNGETIYGAYSSVKKVKTK